MFLDRRDAGVQLAEMLAAYKGDKDSIILALPRGGVVTGHEIARRLNLRLDIIIVRKIGFPGQPELGIGAVSETGTVYLNKEIIAAHGIRNKYIDDETARQKDEMLKRVRLYRRGKGISDLKGATVILVDDGVATGATVKAAIQTLKKEGINKLVLAVPVSPPDTAEELKDMVDEFVCIDTPSYFSAVGSHYSDFTQVSDEEVVELLESQRIGDDLKKAHGRMG